MKKEDKKFSGKIINKVGQAINRYQLIKKNDKILVGISGGKDSFVLIDTLARRKKHLPFDISIIAIHVDLIPVKYKIDLPFYERLCNSLKIPFHVVKTEVDLFKDQGKKPCFTCSWFRRKKLFEIARKNGCNSLALGHHRDDTIETLLMNMIFHGSISSIPESLNMFDNTFKLIRPLLHLREEEIAKYASIHEMPAMEKNCPHENDTRRAEIKKFITEIKTLNPRADLNIFRSMSKIFEEYLPQN